MNVLEALKSTVNYPLSDSNVEAVIIRRGLDKTATLTTDMANSRAYELAYADLLRFVITMVNLSQGGSVTQASVASLTGTANSIYRKYGESEIGEKADTQSRITDRSDIW